MNKSFSYKKAMKELNEIVEAIQSQDIDIDQLATKIKRAQELVGLCREKLRSVEDEVAMIDTDNNSEEA